MAPLCIKQLTKVKLIGMWGTTRRRSVPKLCKLCRYFKEVAIQTQWHLLVP